MEHIKWKINQKKPLEIVALGDIHLGSPECDIPMLKSIVAKIKKRKAKVILLGDLIDLGLRESPGASVYEHNMTPKEQVSEIIKILEPIKGQILSANTGNHEYRLTRSTGIDLSEILAEKLGVNYGKYQCVNTIKLGKQKYNIFSTHGAGSGQTTESRVNSFKKYLEQIDSDVLLFGHCHDLSHRVFTKRIITEKGFDYKNTHLVLCGNFLNFDNSYGELKGYPILKKGCPLIKLYPDKHKVEVSLEWFQW